MLGGGIGVGVVTVKPEKVNVPDLELFASIQSHSSKK